MAAGYLGCYLGAAYALLRSGQLLSSHIALPPTHPPVLIL